MRSRNLNCYSILATLEYNPKVTKSSMNGKGSYSDIRTDAGSPGNFPLLLTNRFFHSQLFIFWNFLSGIRFIFSFKSFACFCIDLNSHSVNCVMKFKKLLWNNLLLIMLLGSTILGILLGALLRGKGPFREPQLHPREMMYLQFPGEIILNIMKVNHLKKRWTILYYCWQSFEFQYWLFSCECSYDTHLTIPSRPENEALIYTDNSINCEKYFGYVCNCL